MAATTFSCIRGVSLGLSLASGWCPCSSLVQLASGALLFALYTFFPSTPFISKPVRRAVCQRAATFFCHQGSKFGPKPCLRLVPLAAAHLGSREPFSIYASSASYRCLPSTPFAQQRFNRSTDLGVLTIKSSKQAVNTHAASQRDAPLVAENYSTTAERQSFFVR